MSESDRWVVRLKSEVAPGSPVLEVQYAASVVEYGRGNLDRSRTADGEGHSRQLRDPALHGIESPGRHVDRIAQLVYRDAALCVPALVRRGDVIGIGPCGVR